MKLLPLLAGALVAAATLTGSAVAMADEAPLDCAAALTAFQDASKAADAAKADDVAAADAKRADDAAADAAAAVDTAQAAAVNGGLSSAQLTAAGAKALRDRRAAILAIPVASRTPAEVDELIKIEKQLPLVDAFLVAEAKAAVAKAAAGATDADALRRKADLTDADALVKAADKARATATDACKGADGVTVTPLPTPPVVVVPIPTKIDTGRA